MEFVKTKEQASLRGEKLIPLKQAVHLDVFWKRPTYRKLYYWATHGIRDKKLESRREGGRIETSAEAVARYLEFLNGVKK